MAVRPETANRCVVERLLDFLCDSDDLDHDSVPFVIVTTLRTTETVTVILCWGVYFSSVR